MLHIFTQPFASTTMNRMETANLLFHCIIAMLLDGYADSETANFVLPVAVQAVVSLLLLVAAVVFLLMVARSTLVTHTANKLRTASLAVNVSEIPAVTDPDALAPHGQHVDDRDYLQLQ